ncbi:MAG: NAD-dependent epimerase/dehydratase family protein [bacterium]
MLNYLKSQAYYPDGKISNQMEGCRILITGASGLVGLNLIASLLLARDSGTNLSIFAIVGSNRDLLIQSLDSHDIHVIQCDLGSINTILNLGMFDIIVHAAGYGQPGKFMSNKLSTITLNSTTLQKLADILSPGGRLLFISTSELYGCGLNNFHTESDVGTTMPQHPRACYIEAKRIGETICEVMREKGVIAYSARLALGYGPGVWMNDQRVLNQFIQKALVQHKIELLDSGNAVRTYCYITNVVEMLLNIILRGTQSVYNVGGKSKTTIKELALLIGEQLEVSVCVPIDSIELEGAPRNVALDLSRYGQEFGPIKFTPLTDGIMRTINWYKHILSAKAEGYEW